MEGKVRGTFKTGQVVVERALEYQGDSLMRWHLSHLFPDPSPLSCRALEGVLGGISRAVGIWLGHFAASPCPATCSHGPGSGSGAPQA